MCRLFMQIGENVEQTIYEEYLQSCSDYIGMKKKDIHEHNETKLYEHGHGFGIAYLKNKHFSIRKFIEPIYERKPFDEIKKSKENLLLIHARRASPDLSITPKNNQPFYWYDDSREFLFAHNGTIKSRIMSFNEKKFFVKGTTDSEKFFYSILTKLEKNNWEMNESLVTETIGSWDYTAANFFLVSPEKAWVGVYYKKDEKYFTMKLYQTKENLIVSSAYLPILGEPKELIKNESLIEINKKHRKYYYLI